METLGQSVVLLYHGVSSDEWQVSFGNVDRIPVEAGNVKDLADTGPFRATSSNSDLVFMLLAVSKVNVVLVDHNVLISNDTMLGISVDYRGVSQHRPSKTQDAKSCG